MEWLLKIVEGPMKGAEIALVEGVAVTFGSGDECDIIVQDATVPAKACEFEVDSAGVRIAAGGGSAELLPSFEIRSFGTTSFAVGPVTGEWQELIKPVRPQLERGDAEPSAGKDAAEEESRPSDSTSGAAEEPAATSPKPPRRRAAVCGVIAILVLALAAGLAWYYWPKIAELYQKTDGSSAASAEKPTQSLADIARQYGLKVSGKDAKDAKLTGNLKRRTERLAIRALALAANPLVKFDLTDDETLLASASELMFACTDGAIKVDAAKDRAVTISGYAPSREALEKAIRALNADVKGIDRVDAKNVRVGGTAPAAVAKTPFVREAPPGEHPVVAIPAHTPNPPLKKSAKEKDCPIAGILTDPYPCVVMRNGARLVEGAQIGKAILVKIEADKLTLNEGGREVVWKP